MSMSIQFMIQLFYNCNSDLALQPQQMQLKINSSILDIPLCAFVIPDVDCRVASYA